MPMNSSFSFSAPEVRSSSRDSSNSCVSSTRLVRWITSLGTWEKREGKEGGGGREEGGGGGGGGGGREGRGEGNDCANGVNVYST